MNPIRVALNQLVRATTNQTPTVKAAAHQARMRGRTRTARAFNHVGRRIQDQTSNHAQG